MNERLVFLLSASAAELGASAIFFLLLPESPLAARFPNLLGYLAAHAIPTLCLWVPLVLLSAALMPKLWRRRQNRATKLSLLARAGLLGLAIDGASSLYLWHHNADEGDPGSLIPSFLLRLGIYALVFALTVALADLGTKWHDSRKPPAATPPPRFGRA